MSNTQAFFIYFFLGIIIGQLLRIIQILRSKQ